MAIKASIKDNKLTIVADLNPEGVVSKSGKSKVHASTNGNVHTDVQINGKGLVIGLNAYTPA